jgi:D-galactose 1-dehydrogenase
VKADVAIIGDRFMLPSMFETAIRRKCGNAPTRRSYETPWPDVPMRHGYAEAGMDGLKEYQGGADEVVAQVGDASTQHFRGRYARPRRPLLPRTRGRRRKLPPSCQSDADRAYLVLSSLREDSELPPYTIAIIGVGKVAREEHLPVIAENPRFKLVGVVSQRGAEAPGVPSFRTPAELYDRMPDLSAVAICTPPHVRHEIAREALDAGKHVLLEKPPTRTMAELRDLTAYAAERRRSIFATWHAQYNAAVDEAKKRLAGRKIRSLSVNWKEDVRQFHPGHDWIWDADNSGVFDPGVNALSILTKIMPRPPLVDSAALVYPANRDAPIAASLVLTSEAAESPATRIVAEFDWRHKGDKSWEIDIETDEGDELRLTHGGSTLFVNGVKVVETPNLEYRAIYERFARLLDAGESAMDASSFELVVAAFRVGVRQTTVPFHW